MDYINLQHYLTIKPYIGSELHLTNIEIIVCKNNTSNSLFYNYLLVDKIWVKQVREKLKKNSLFYTIKTNKPLKLKTLKKIKYNITI
ncbi:hypothetical protein UFOVP758_42 [uncultured Caudovirales phage]|uniref:Uncharacterized protein n=1 Tax=uncultured Caudovirales phage TaxID=2100421 RepID=A0A6J7X8R7_9CAUD|nr:hypothetical protein UFOVP758_42 [uncultured Caudovirales phage]